MLFASWQSVHKLPDYLSPLFFVLILQLGAYWEVSNEGVYIPIVGM